MPRGDPPRVASWALASRMQHQPGMWRRMIIVLAAVALLGGCAAQATVAVPAGETVTSYGVFYDALDPYGSWVLTADNGWVWIPSPDVVGADFYPYETGGYWVFTDDGWSWDSDYPWGWAPFHYGRWHHDDRYGWEWIPGHEWAPAWVRWHHEHGHVAWAPLPPRNEHHHVPAHWVVGVEGPHGHIHARPSYAQRRGFRQERAFHARIEQRAHEPARSIRRQPEFRGRVERPGRFREPPRGLRRQPAFRGRVVRPGRFREPARGFRRMPMFHARVEHRGGYRVREPARGFRRVPMFRGRQAHFGGFRGQGRMRAGRRR